VLNAILSHTNYGLVDDFKETDLGHFEVTTLAQTYTREMTGLGVKNLETFVHHLIREYEEYGKYASMLYHLSENKERMAVLKHIVEDHIANTADDEDDMFRSQEICRKYILNFEIPHTGNTACLDKTGNTQSVKRIIHSHFLARSSILTSIITDKILRGADMDDSKVTVGELATAVWPQKLYKLNFFAGKLSLGHHIHKSDTFPLINGCQEWRKKLLVYLESKNWKVNIREIISLHRGVYTPDTPRVHMGISQNTFFLGHENSNLVMWCVNSFPSIPFPDQSPTTVTLGGMLFKKAANKYSNSVHPIKAPTLSPVSTHGERTPFEQNSNLHGKEKVNRKEILTPQMQNDLKYDMSKLSERINSISHSLSVEPRTKVATQSNDLSMLREQEYERVVVYTARNNPWRVWRGQSDNGRNIISHLMQQRVKLPDSNSEGSDDN